jgi:phosphoribosylformylglycinamidine synthase
MLVKIFITLKPGVLDPQGLSIKNALNILGFSEVEDVRVGKYLQLRLETTKDSSDSSTAIKEMCEKLLANPVIEDYYYEVIDGTGK